MFSYFEPNFIKDSFGKVVFQTLAKIETTQNKNRLFGRHFEMVQHFFPPELWFLTVHTYMVQISLQNSSGKVVFLGGSMESTLGTNWSKSNLVT